MSQKFSYIADLWIVTGSHSFVPPGFAKGDIRGPCPGLSVLANHGYLPHNGVATVSNLQLSVVQVLTLDSFYNTRKLAIMVSINSDTEGPLYLTSIVFKWVWNLGVLSRSLAMPCPETWSP
jgi:hypothetical protein